MFNNAFIHSNMNMNSMLQKKNLPQTVIYNTVRQAWLVHMTRQLKLHQAHWVWNWI